MTSPISADDILRAYKDRQDAGARARIDTAKLVVTISLGFGVTIVATALQVPPVRVQDVASSWLLVASLAATVAVLGFDRWYEPDVRVIAELAARRGLDRRVVLRALAAQEDDLRVFNVRVVTTVRCAATAQLALVVVTTGLALWSLLLS